MHDSQGTNANVRTSYGRMINTVKERAVGQGMIDCMTNET